MKLISLHIENFGILHNFDYSFSDQLNVICEENGTGKTTLGVFIKVMFYGFSNEKKRSNLEKERYLYKPWINGTYGGTIVFKYNQKMYRLSRLFGNKESQDVFQLKNHITGLDSHDFKDVNIGPELFGIDAASFARTMFISQKEYEFDSFNDIDAKMGTKFDSIEDMSVYENAMKRLEDEISKITTKKKTGTLDRINAQIQDLRNDLLYKAKVEASLEELENTLSVKNQAITDKKQDIISLQQELKKISSIKEKMQKKERYKIFLDAYENAERDLKEKKSYFPKEIPDQQLETKIQDAQNLSIFFTQQEENRLSEKEKNVLSHLSKKYKNVDISSLDFEETEKHILSDLQNVQYILSNDLSVQENELLIKENNFFEKNYSNERTKQYINSWEVERKECLESIQKNQLSITEEEQLLKLEDKFRDKKVDLEYLELLKRDWTGKREEALSIIESCKLSYSEQNQLSQGEKIFSHSFHENDLKIHRDLWGERNDILKKVKQDEEIILNSKSQNVYSIFLIIGLIFFISAFFLYFINVTISVLTGILAIVLLGIHFIKNSKENDVTNLEKERLEKNNRIQQIEKQVASFLATYGYSFEENGVFLYLNDLANTYKRFIDLKNMHQQYQTTINNQKKIVQSIDSKVEEVLHTYGYDFVQSDVSYILNDINNQFQAYISLKQRKEQYLRGNEANELHVEQIEELVLSYLQNFGYPNDKSKVSNDLYDLSHRYEQWSLLKRKAENEKLIHSKNQHKTLSFLIQQFFDKCLVKVGPNEYVEKFNAIKEEVYQLKVLSKKSHNYEIASQKYESLLKNICSYISSYGFLVKENIVSQLDDIQNHVQAYETSIISFNTASINKNRFERENPDFIEWMELLDPYGDDAFSNTNIVLEKERYNIDVLKDEKIDLESKLSDLNDRYNDLCDKEGLIQVLLEEQTALVKRISLLRNTRMLLEEAKSSLNLKYSAPVRNALEKYFNILGKNAGFSVEVNVKKEISINSHGISRDIKFLSEGYKDIVDLCFRFALVDAMYLKEKPLIILDDPFINLDAQKIKKGLALLDEVKKEYQILYLTCHESRI